MKKDDLRCSVLLIGFLCFISGFIIFIFYSRNNDIEYKKCEANGISNTEDMLLCFNLYTFNSHAYLKDFKLNDFTFNQKPYYSDRAKYPYTFKSCTFNNMVIELNPLENVQFIDCTFINTKVNDTLIQNVLFLNCIFEESEFSNCIFGKNVKYYDWTISTLKLTNNTYTPEHIENGVNKFETFVESSME